MLSSNRLSWIFGDPLRYNFPLKGTPTFCSRGERNTLDHSLICKKGGFVSMRHNQIRDLEAMLMSEVCKDVQREPPLLPLSGEMFNLRSTNTASEARLDISARGIWNPVDKTFFDVRVFHPVAESNKTTTIEAAFEKHEQETRRRGHTTGESLRLKRQHLLLWSFQPPEGWGRKLRSFTRG